MEDFKTISKAEGPFLYREKKSKFLGMAFPAASVEAAERILSELRKQYSDATHVCYAYRIGIENTRERISDDGEPAHTAGSPIYGQIISSELHDVLVCVIRYYGGTKLGAGGLTQAYREAARGVLESAAGIEKKAGCILRLEFEYPNLDAVMGFISQNRLEITEQEMGLSCALEIIVSREKSESFKKRLQAIQGVRLSKRNVYL